MKIENNPSGHIGSNGHETFEWIKQTAVVCATISWKARDVIFKKNTTSGETKIDFSDIPNAWYSKERNIYSFSSEKLCEAIRNRSKNTNATIIDAPHSGSLHDRILIVWDNEESPMYIKHSEEPVFPLDPEISLSSSRISDFTKLIRFSKIPVEIAKKEGWGNMTGKELIEKIATLHPDILKMIQDNFELRLKGMEEIKEIITKDTRKKGLRKFCKEIYNNPKSLSQDEVSSILFEMMIYSDSFISKAELSHL